MQPPASPRKTLCPACLSEVGAQARFCGTCAAPLHGPLTEELRGVSFLLSELARWESSGTVTPAQASELRGQYELRRENLRAQLKQNGAESQPPAATGVSPNAPPSAPRPEVPPARGESAATPEKISPTESRPPVSAPDVSPAQRLAPPPTPVGPDRRPAPATSGAYTPSFAAQRPKRTLFETLSDPYTVRLLLYTGAGMVTVAVVIWLRDLLYLKLREPAIQAALLALGTVAVASSGWYTSLRTRLRFTGRALTLAGSLLVPVNFWFLVRSGLIRSHGRAWMVCAVCTLLYGLTARFLRERLYVYLACAAAVATLWALVFRYEPRASGLYALTLAGASLVFIHLSRLFAAAEDEEASPQAEGAAQVAVNGRPRSTRHGYEFWGGPLVQVGLVGVTFSLFAYTPLRLLPNALSFESGIFHWRASVYEPGVAIMLCVAWAYAAWLTGRFIRATLRTILYTLATLALFWAELLLLDGFRASATISLLWLTASALAVSACSRLARTGALPRALHAAGAVVSVTLAFAAATAFLNEPTFNSQRAAAWVFLALGFAFLSAPRFCDKAAQASLAVASAVSASAAFVVATESLALGSRALHSALYAAWPFTLYAVALLARRTRMETQLAGPFERTAEVEFVPALLWAGLLALVLNIDPAGSDAQLWRSSVFILLGATTLFGAARAALDRSAFGALLGAAGALVLVAAFQDSLKAWGALPSSWPVAAGIVCAAFLVGKMGGAWLEKRQAAGAQQTFGPHGAMRLVADLAAGICALVWFCTALYFIYDGGRSAAFVLLLALLYWAERAAAGRLTWAAHLASIHAGAFFVALLVALRADPAWFALWLALVLPPAYFAAGQQASKRGADWLALPASRASTTAAALAFFIALLQATTHLRVGDRGLLAPCVTAGTVALLSFAAGLRSGPAARVRYFRAGLFAGVVSFALGCLRAGFDPAADVEVYTSPVAVALMAFGYVSLRADWEEYERDRGALLWLGSLLLCGPLLMHALEYRLVLDLPAPWRDLGVLCAAVALILFSVFGRLRAPMIVGLITLVTELAALALKSVDWLQVPVKVYLITVGSLLALAGWMLEFRREQLAALRDRLNRRRDLARERFKKWR